MVVAVSARTGVAFALAARAATAAVAAATWLLGGVAGSRFIIAIVVCAEILENKRNKPLEYHRPLQSACFIRHSA